MTQSEWFDILNVTESRIVTQQSRATWLHRVFLVMKKLIFTYRKCWEFHFLTAAESAKVPLMTSGRFLATWLRTKCGTSNGSKVSISEVPRYNSRDRRNVKEILGARSFDGKIFTHLELLWMPSWVRRTIFCPFYLVVLIDRLTILHNRKSQISNSHELNNFSLTRVMFEKNRKILVVSKGPVADVNKRIHLSISTKKSNNKPQWRI